MGIPILIRGWRGPLCHALRQLLSHAPAEAHLFRNTLSHASQFGNDLARDATSREIAKKERRPERYPLASFLLGMPGRPIPLERTLAWLALEAHLCGGYGNLVIALAQIIRGLTGKAEPKLRDTLAQCDGPSQLLTKMERLAGLVPALGITGHQNFDSLWRSDLQAFCVSLVRQASSPTDCPDELLFGPTDHPGPLTEGPTDTEGDDPDENTFIPSVPATPEENIRNKRLRGALDWSTHMSRQSAPDLLRPSENVLPKELRAREWQIAVAQAEKAISRGNLQEAQYLLTAVLSIEAGLNSREAISASFGSKTDSRIPVIDLSIHAMRRPERLPPNYFLPKGDDDRWLATGGDAIFPLSRECVALAQQLLDNRESKPDVVMSYLLLAGPVDKAKLRHAIKPNHRLVLAIELSDVIGLDAAQWAFGDSFGMSTAATFYGSYPALDLARAIAVSNGFAAQNASAPWVVAAEHSLGSRTRPKHAPYEKAWSQLKGGTGRTRGRPSDRHVIGEWRQRLDRLVIHFLLATGHRPTKSLAEIILHDFVPEHALAIVSDKLADPAHSTRAVCTGWRFMGELEGFVTELKRLARNSEFLVAKNLAARILSGKAPLFSIPTHEGTESIEIRDLLRNLDPLWGYRPNLHRHGLCQFLIERRVDPELRYFQMGWLSHDHHATSDSAPYPPVELGQDLASHIDDWLDQCGWHGGGKAQDLRKILPVSVLDDWKEKRNAHFRGISSAITAIRADVKEAGNRLEGKIWSHIRTETQQVLSQFEASVSSDRPHFIPTYKVAIETSPQATIDQLQVEALLAPFSTRSFSASDRYVAAKLLHKALRSTAKANGVRVYLPVVHVMSRHQVPSPFLPGIGSAVRQIDELQSALVAHANSIDGKAGADAVNALAAISVLSIVLHTPYCAIDKAISILRGAKDALHSDSQAWLLRVPVENEHVVLRGDQAALALRLLKFEGWKAALERLSVNGHSVLGTFVKGLLPNICGKDVSASEIVTMLIHTARSANAVRFNGAERLILNGITNPVAVPAVRAASTMDDITVAGDGKSRNSANQLKDECPHVGKNPPHKPTKDISSVMRAFDPDFVGEILGKAAEPVAKRRPQLKQLLTQALYKVGADPTASRLILEYAWHLLEVGGPRSSGGQAISTIYKTLHRIEPALRGIGRDESLVGLSAVELTALCQASCEGSRRQSSREVLGELRRFFGHTSRRYGVGNPDWDLLYRTHGIRLRGGDPALVGDIEASRLMEQLYNNVLGLGESDWDPGERRYRELCLIGALFSESSGGRPRSIHGLTFADVSLGQDRDFLIFRSRGRFASIKTQTAAGFIPLEGELWNKYANWFYSWYANACAGLPADALQEIPLFQIPGEAIGVRYEMRRIFGPIGSLVRWSTQQQQGRTYWLRKRRVRSRHVDVLSRKSLARDMARAMRLDGHALILTPLGNYLSEPMAYVTNHTGDHAIASRAGAVAITGLAKSQVDRASYVYGQNSNSRVAALLSLGATNFLEVELPSVPQLPKFRADLMWMSLEKILRDLVRGKDAKWVAARHSILLEQVDSIILAQRDFSARMKAGFGDGKFDIGPPREGGLSRNCLELIAKEDQRLVSIAKDWVAMAPERRYDDGCHLYEVKALQDMVGIANDLGLRTECSCSFPGYGVALVRFVEEGNASIYGAWRVIRWVLAVAWIAEQRRLYR